MPAKAQIFTGPDSARQAQKAADKQKKAQIKQQRKAMKKYQKEQRKAAKQRANITLKSSRFISATRTLAPPFQSFDN